MSIDFPTVNGIQVLLPAPSGYTVDLDHPRRIGDIAAYWAFGIGNTLALLLLGQRLYTKIYIKDGIQIDDVLIVLSWITSEIIQCILLYAFAEGITGVHGWELTIEKYKMFLLLSWIVPWVYILCWSLAKISLLTVYFRLSPFGWFRTCTVTALVLVVCHTIVLMFCTVLSCIPIKKSWDINYPLGEGRCFDLVALYMSVAIVNIITDAILLLMPIPLIMGLNMPEMKKPLVLVVFIFASATIVTSIVRCAYLPSLYKNDDETWFITKPTVWMIIEANLAVVCASTTTLRRFLYHVAPKIMGRTSDAGENVVHGNTPNINFCDTTRGQIPRQRDQYSKYGDEHELLPYRVGTQANLESGAQGSKESWEVDQNEAEPGRDSAIINQNSDRDQWRA
ncbi:hypothetical protein VPNG_06795 [Cytospora leucostoma]|uniref:Rhodopsin domain-containing protein n=1 Tax=Cytospora leucostoma TaxID=1230097 RepID=A0A423WVW4_9PEZI|nr:hypothetical protein VPNG_06795 [Cytospora leucostoma]